MMYESGVYRHTAAAAAAVQCAYSVHRFGALLSGVIVVVVVVVVVAAVPIVAVAVVVTTAVVAVAVVVIAVVVGAVVVIAVSVVVNGVPWICTSRGRRFHHHWIIKI